MERLKELKRFRDVRGIREFLELLREEEIESLAGLVLAVLFLTPLVKLLINFVQLWSFDFVMEPVQRMGTILGGLVLLLFFGKRIASGQLRTLFVRDNIPVMLLAGMAVWMLLSRCIAGFTDYDLYGCGRMESVFTYLQNICIWFGCGAVIRSKAIKKWLFRIFAISGGIITFFALLHFYTNCVRQFNTSMQYYVDAVFMNTNYYGYYLTMLILLCAAMIHAEEAAGWRIFFAVNYLMSTYVLVLNKTIGAYLAVFFGLGYLLIVQKLTTGHIPKRTFLLLGAFLLISLLLWCIYGEVLKNFFQLFRDVKKVAEASEDAGRAGSGRMILYRLTLQAIFQQPLWGFGTDGIEEMLMLKGDVNRTHNEPLQYTAFYGIPAGLLYLSGVFGVFLHGAKHRKKLDVYTVAALTAAFGYFFSSMFGVTTFFITPLFFAFLGLGFRFAEPEQNHDVKN